MCLGEGVRRCVPTVFLKATLCLGEGVRRCVPNVFLKATLCLEEGVRRWHDPRALTLLDAQT